MLQRVYVTIFVENFCLTVTKRFVGEPFCALFQKISGSPKSLWLRVGGSIKIFRPFFFCLAVPKNAVGEPFSLSLISGIEKVWMRGWGGGGRSAKIFRRNFRVSQCRNFS